ncbi:MAG: tautomerase family protein [Acidimicrobiales bacterium]|nr:tautomerase family protein [Acidimicrobiales bacterium]
MPYVHVTIATGRSPDAKKKLMTLVSEAVSKSIDAPLENVRVWITEVPPEDMSIGGVPLDIVRAQRAAAAANDT